MDTGIGTIGLIGHSSLMEISLSTATGHRQSEYYSSFSASLASWMLM